MNSVANVKAVVLLGPDGRRFIAKYFDEDLAARSKQIEKQLFSRTKASKSKDGLFVLNALVVVYKFVRNSYVYVLGEQDENPCMMDIILNCYADVINSLDALHTDYRSRILSTVVEEVVNGLGVVFEPDPEIVRERIESQGQDEQSHSVGRLMGYFSTRRLYDSISSNSSASSTPFVSLRKNGTKTAAVSGNTLSTNITLPNPINFDNSL
jgi:hypothetical protein